MTSRGLGTFRPLVGGFSRNSNKKLHDETLGDIHNEEPLLGLHGHSNGDFQWAVLYTGDWNGGMSLGLEVGVKNH